MNLNLTIHVNYQPAYGDWRWRIAKPGNGSAANGKARTEADAKRDAANAVRRIILNTR